ncbi:MAG TPA: ATP-dependent Clp protease adaptor ClpS [Tepidisphaeraceae bacterium]|jgi:ATP-dependent Clp protease adaptor protein ClpS
MSKESSTPTKPAEKKASAKRPDPKANKPKHLPPYHVILLDDNDHSYEYVIEMLKVIFGYEDHKGFVLAEEVNDTGRSIVFTTHRELAELKRDQIHAYGKDTRVATCVGSMSAVIEPAED